MARAGAAVVLFALVCCLLVAPAPARRPAELPPQVILDAVDRDAAAEPLLPKPLAVDADAAHPAVREEEEMGRARAHGTLVFRCGGDAAVLSSSQEPLSLDGGRAQPAMKGEVEEQQRPYDSDSSDSDWDSDSDDQDEEDGIVGRFWGLARLF